MLEIFDNEAFNASKLSLLEIENIEANNARTKATGISIMALIF